MVEEQLEFDFMAKEESRSERPDFFAKGGSTKMFGKGHTGKSEAGVSGKSSQGSAQEWPEGGSDHMFGKGHAGKKVPGVSGKQSQEG